MWGKKAIHDTGIATFVSIGDDVSGVRMVHRSETFLMLLTTLCGLELVRDVLQLPVELPLPLHRSLELIGKSLLLLMPSAVMNL